MRIDAIQRLYLALMLAGMHAGVAMAEPQIVWEVENPFRFFLDQRQTQRVPVKRNRLLVTVAWTFDRDICTAREMRTVDVGNHVEKKCWQNERATKSLFYPLAEPSAPGSVMPTGSSARFNSSSGKTFRSRQSSRTVRPVFALSFAISAARS